MEIFVMEKNVSIIQAVAVQEYRSKVEKDWFPSYGDGQKKFSVGYSQAEDKFYVLCEGGDSSFCFELAREIYRNIRWEASRICNDLMIAMYGPDHGHGIGSSDVNVHVNRAAFEAFTGRSAE